jgi:hypothetical protein
MMNNKTLHLYQATLLITLLLLSACEKLGSDSSSSPLPSSPLPTFTSVSIEIPEPTSMPKPTETLEPTATSLPCPPFQVENVLPVLDIPADYIGHHFDAMAMPPGLVSEGGFVIGELPTNYSLHKVWQGDIMMLWLEKMICRDEGKAYHEIRDVLILPPLRENERLITLHCTTDQEFAPEIVVIGEFEPDVCNPTRIVQAWRANQQTESFEPLFPDSVTCDLTNTGPGGCW